MPQPPAAVGGGQTKSLRYNGSLEWVLLYAKFRTLSRYYGWTDDDRLLALSVSVEGPALKYFHILSSQGEEMNFGKLALNSGLGRARSKLHLK